MYVPRIVCSIALAMLLGANVGCAASSSTELKQDSWYTGIPSDISGLVGWSDLEEFRIHNVKSDMESRAEGMLESNQLVLLTMDQVNGFLGYIPNTLHGNNFYLVRSCFVNDKTGGYYISFFKSYLWVSHASLDRYPAAMKRRALVLQLEHIPEHVYITCSFAE